MREAQINSKISIMISRNGMGEGDPELTHKLLKNFLSLLSQEERVPAYICIYADAVKFACQHSPVADELKALEQKGTKIIICKTCLLFYGLIDKTVTGTVGTMIDIIDIQHNSTKIINL